ncbi:MAG: hypothetical protein L6R43_18405 [Planctomycetes bacterium]|nr:hypothetical protein [Planctomycetota bacterium]
MTNLRRRLRLPILAFLLLFLASCVEVDGQRITLSYDREADVLRLLLHYDGIHDKEDGKKGADQLATFVAEGDLMLLDWYGHVEMAELRKEAGKEPGFPALGAFKAALVDSVKCTVVGHYRDHRGTLGALQLVEVRRASALVRKANAALNEAILGRIPESEWARTADRMRPGAAEEKQWIFLDGHSVGISFPAHPAEWSRNKVEFIADGVKETARKVADLDARVAEEAPEEVVEVPVEAGMEPPSAAEAEASSEERERRQARERRSAEAGAGFFGQFLGMSPVAIVETAESVMVRIGDPGRPSTFRFRLRDEELANMDAAVLGVAPRSLDDALADRLLGGPVPEDPGVRADLEWGPPEEAVRALLARAASSSGERRKAALDGLVAFAARWNREVGIPRAPAPGETAGGPVPPATPPGPAPVPKPGEAEGGARPEARPVAVEKPPEPVFDPEKDPAGYLRAWGGWYEAVLRGPGK